MRGIETKPGLDRDEYPPAMFQEGGQEASVRHITAGDNRSRHLYWRSMQRVA
ncbi:NucA/NucB deoxyribonuclease domain-containing protein [Pseudomonas atacamensis]|uniref:NucA/NucB deoxyribonuclease domain-containing protein n=1 Tax=Pseudomonas atacamensis TaxID=2565368 RepID=UPI003C8C3270